MKDYLSAEHDRNLHNHRLYERLLRLAHGPDLSVLVAHHITITLEVGGDPNEIPSADTLLFDHEFMGRAFGQPTHFEVMAQLAVEPVGRRDLRLEEFVAREEEIRAGRRAEELAATAIDAG